MENPQSILEIKTENLYNIAFEVAEDFLGVFAGEQLSEVFTNSCFDELEVNKIGISRSELYLASSIVISEIIAKDKLNKQAKKDIQKVLIDSERDCLATV